MSSYPDGEVGSNSNPLRWNVEPKLWGNAPSSQVVTLDLDYEATTFAEETFQKTGLSKVIKLIKGPASET